MRQHRLLYLLMVAFAAGTTYLMVSMVSDRTRPDLPLEGAPILSLPVAGTWQSIRSPGHDRFAFDLAAVDPVTHQTLTVSRVQHALGRAQVSDSHSWSEPVLSPVRGTVVRASDGWPDRERLHLLRDVGAMIFSRPSLDPEDIRPFAGNYVIIQSEGFYVFLAHMKAGSLRVREGDAVETGQLLGSVGNSGFTLAPHLHFELFDQIDNPLAAETLPFVIDRYERWDGQAWTPVNHAPLRRGELIRSAPASP
jgi:hypothetical protein